MAGASDQNTGGDRLGDGADGSAGSTARGVRRGFRRSRVAGVPADRVTKPRASRSAAEDLLELQLRERNLVGWIREHRFHPVRKWRFDFAHPQRLLAVEVEGFARGGGPGRHQRISGFSADAEKYAEATILGWRLIRCTTRQVKTGEAIKWIERAIG